MGRKRHEPGPQPKRVRCAIYTRKSTEEGLQQDFNTLDAQRDSAEKYIASQAGEGWVCLPDQYDDGGFTGGNMERPALQRLLADVDAGRIDCIVVYKVDRLSRSILDFARIMERFDQGHLCPLRTKAGSLKPDTAQLHVRGGEYIAGEVEALMDDDNLVRSACREIIDCTRDRRSVLIFASGVRHGQHICGVLTERHRAECGFICGETLPSQRDEVIGRFRNGDLKYLCNVNVLSTGFDAPNIDCVALVRPTLSPGLYYQMVGRGFRLHPGKTDCKVLDFGGNVLRHGPVDRLRLDVTCSPNLDPVAMRVSTACTAGKEAAHEGQTAFARTDHRQAARGRRALGHRRHPRPDLSEAGDRRTDLPPLAQPVRRHEGQGRQAAQGAGAGERPAQEAGGRPGARPVHPQGDP
jgi:hypothetical protein